MWFCGFFSVYNDGRLGREVSTDPGSFDHLEAISYRGRFHTESCGLRLGRWWWCRRQRRRLDSLYSLTVPCWGHLRSSMDILLRTLVQQLKELYPVPTKVEKILIGSLDLIPSPLPSVKIQIIGGKVCFRCNCKTLLGVVNKLLKTKCLLTSMRTLELVQPFFTSFEYWKFFGFSS